MATGTKPSELRELTDPELVERLREAKAELFNLRVQAATGQLDNNRRLQVVRREIARIYTILRERLSSLPRLRSRSRARPVSASRPGRRHEGEHRD